MTLNSLYDGASIIGVFKGDDFIVDFGDGDIIEKGDTIMIVGKKDAVVEFEVMCEGKDQ
ncbi:TrkA C-terminal domain-containing protein [Bacillus sp. JCM 19034]|uniref:TrkA C-terminal domain-containing protein n=1 Tax=Bacillus sp. JCM 19034 TaxID=1481928 RepID=UPI0012E0FE8F|nr:TrkA C-terminal domain-containing protein [Bacillus sp. JCM 19034]